MSSSQFTVYSSSDAGAGAPGVMFGAAGDLIRVMDACLVNGYTGKTAAGWSKPIANSGTNTACYKPGVGSSNMTLFVNDNGPNGSSTYKEAWVTGWESISSLQSPVGTGAGQFPTPAQSLTTGHLVWRKSVTADNTNGRSWLILADQYTFYGFFSTGDTAGVYYGGMFGDLFSMNGASDPYRCIIHGRNTENSAAATITSAWDATGHLGVTTNTSGMFMPGTFGGSSGSLYANQMGDVGKIGSSVSSVSNCSLVGGVQTPNGPDNSLYLSPLWVYEVAALSIRGRLRGLYHVCHPLASFSDGQTFSGANDYAGKSFRVVLKGPNNGFLAAETSATVETN